MTSFGRCKCGGRVLGEMDHGRWFTWCTKCTPVVEARMPMAADGDRAKRSSADDQPDSPGASDQREARPEAP